MATTLPADKQEPTLAEVSTLDEKAGFRSDSPEDKIIPDSEGVTEEEFATLRRLPDRLPWTAWLVAVVEFAERCVSTVLLV